MTPQPLDVRRTALLFFDMLNAYYHTDAALERAAELLPVIENCVQLRRAANAAGIPCVYAKANHRPDGRDTAARFTDADYDLKPWKNSDLPDRTVPKAAAGSWEGEIIPELAPEPADTVVAKKRWSSFYQTHLGISLRTLGIDTIILVGGSIEVGIASTAYSARDRDYNLIIVSDACTSRRPDIHELFMGSVFPLMARVRRTAEVIALIRQSAPPGSPGA